MGWISWPMPPIICCWTFQGILPYPPLRKYSVSLPQIQCSPHCPITLNMCRVLICGRILGPVATRVLTAHLYNNRMRTPTSAPVLPLSTKQVAHPSNLSAVVLTALSPSSILSAVDLSQTVLSLCGHLVKWLLISVTMEHL